MQVKASIRWAILPLVIIFLFFNGYGHFILHEFMGHKDTVHNIEHDPTQKYFESEHIHCDIMDLHLEVPTPFVAFNYVIYNSYTTVYLIPDTEYIPFLSFNLLRGRGPPL